MPSAECHSYAAWCRVIASDDPPTTTARRQRPDERRTRSPRGHRRSSNHAREGGLYVVVPHPHSSGYGRREVVGLTVVTCEYPRAVREPGVSLTITTRRLVGGNLCDQVPSKASALTRTLSSAHKLPLTRSTPDRCKPLRLRSVTRRRNLVMIMPLHLRSCSLPLPPRHTPRSTTPDSKGANSSVRSAR